jgi:phosphatidate cytidylyltransferase
MVKRVLVAVVFVPVILLLIYAAPPIALPMALAVICGIAVYEALVSTDFLKHFRMAGYSIVLAAAIPFWVYFGSDSKLALPALFLYVVLLFCEAIGSHKRVGLEKMGGAFFLAVFIPYFLSSFLRLRQTEEWRFTIILPFVIAFLSDAFALFAGRAFGKHKLAPDLSPKKTVEGAVGGLLGAIVSALVTGLIFQVFFGLEGVNYPALAVYGALGSLVSQLGDLSFSYIKREYGIKDFGNILPGHGGILDRFDSVIFCAPLVELLLYVLPVVR